MFAYQPRSRLHSLGIFGLSACIALLGIKDLHAQAPCEQAVLTNPLALDGGFGETLDFDGETIAAGMPSVSFSPGYAFIYGRTPDGLELQAQLQAPDGKNGDEFGQSIAIEGDHLLVGRRGDGALNLKGSVYAFRRQPSGAWLMTQKIVIDKPINWALGWSLAIDGNRVAIGASGATFPGMLGRVFVFEFENGLWVQKAVITPSQSIGNDWFGDTVVLQGDRLVVGAPQHRSGQTHIFERQGTGAWVQQAVLTPSQFINYSCYDYGRAVAIDGDTVAVGAILRRKVVTGPSTVFVYRGITFVYRLGPTGWSIEQELIPQGESDTISFGRSLSLMGDELFVGAPWQNASALSTGFVYRYRRQGSTWTSTAKFQASSALESRLFGAALARHGDELLISAPANLWISKGKVHLHALNPSTQLTGLKSQVSTSAGGTQPLQLAACSEHAGDFYLLLGSLSGTAPALPLGPVDLPLVYDAYTEFTLTAPNSLVLPGSLGQLDAWGRADTTFRLPPGAAPSFIGETAHHAFLVLDLTTLALETVSNPTPVLLAP